MFRTKRQKRKKPPCTSQITGTYSRGESQSVRDAYDRSIDKKGSMTDAAGSETSESSEASWTDTSETEATAFSLGAASELEENE
jgi:hypothetical protein